MAHIIVGLILLILPSLFKSIFSEEEYLQKLSEENKDDSASLNDSIVASSEDIRNVSETGSSTENVSKNKESILKDLKVALEKVKEGVRKQSENINVNDNSEAFGKKSVLDNTDILTADNNGYEEPALYPSMQLPSYKENPVGSLEYLRNGGLVSSVKNRLPSPALAKISQENTEPTEQIPTKEVHGDVKNMFLPEAALGSGRKNMNMEKLLQTDLKPEVVSGLHPNSMTEAEVILQTSLNSQIDVDSDASSYIPLAYSDSRRKESMSRKQGNKQRTIDSSVMESSILYNTTGESKNNSERTANNFVTFLSIILKRKHVTKYDEQIALRIQPDYLALNVTSDQEEEAVSTIDESAPESYVESASNETLPDENKTSESKEEGSVAKMESKLKDKTIDAEQTEDKDQLETYSQFAERVSAEKKNGVSGTSSHGNNGYSSKGPKVKTKNYASTDCGAKLISANPEASHSSKIIHSDKDEYMLNKCADKIWAIVELCENIRPQKFDIANFELFSNLPKDMQLFGSHRFPTREWTSLGIYIGEEGNRELQSFPVDTEEIFKYIKIEVLSHYGTEFFCPISLFRIFGISEFEVIDQMEETEDIVSEEEEAEVQKLEEKDKEKPGMIPYVLKSMINRILDVVKRGSRSNSVTDEPEQFSIYTHSCVSLHTNYAIPKDSCLLADSLNYILACFSDEYQKLIMNPFLALTVQDSFFCHLLANISCSSPDVDDSLVYDTVCNNSYVCAMLSPKHVLAMCYMNDPSVILRDNGCRGIFEESAVISDNYSVNTNVNITDGESSLFTYNVTVTDSFGSKTPIEEEDLEKFQPLEGSTNYSSLVQEMPSVHEEEKAQRTSEKESDTSIDSHLQQEKKDKLAKGKSHKSVNTSTGARDHEETVSVSSTTSHKLGKQELTPQNTSAFDNDSSVGISQGGILTPPTTAVPTSVSSESRSGVGSLSSSTNKESVVVRLSNKIKVLEQNMSISSQYLEELSRRYKRQMEEMQHQFNVTIMALNRTSETAFERDLHHQRHIETLEEQLEHLSRIINQITQEKEDFMTYVIGQHLILFTIEIVVLCLAFVFCIQRHQRHPARKSSSPAVHVAREIRTASEQASNSAVNTTCSKEQGVLSIRRMSLDSVQMKNKGIKARRPSGEMENLSGNYEHLLVETLSTEDKTAKEKRKKKKRSSLKRSLSNSSFSGKARSLSYDTSKKETEEKMKRSSSGILFSAEKRADTARKTIKELTVKAKEIEGWNKVKSKNVNRTKQEKEMTSDHSVNIISKNSNVQHSYNPVSCISNGVRGGEIISYDKHHNPKVGITDTLTPTNEVFAPSQLDCNAPAVIDYYDSLSSDRQVYPALNPTKVEEIDETSPIWSADQSRSKPFHLVNGKMKLRSDNWQWYSSQLTKIPMQLKPSCSLGSSSSILSQNYGTDKSASNKAKKKKKNRNGKPPNGT